MPPRWVLRSAPGWPRSCRPAASGRSLAGRCGGRWPWTGRRCGVPGMPAMTGGPYACSRWPISKVGAVLARDSVEGRTTEITRFAPLLEPLDLAGCVVTADAMHTQREHAEFLITAKSAHYLLVVKKNQPALYAQLKNLPWRALPAGHKQRDRRRGRQEHRTLQAATVAAGICFPHAAQALRITRRIWRQHAQRPAGIAPPGPGSARSRTCATLHRSAGRDHGSMEMLCRCRQNAR
jgi:predicted transposase YbfD/YdcC